MLTFREARRADVPVIIGLLADDDVSRARDRAPHLAPGPDAAGLDPSAGVAAGSAPDRAGPASGHDVSEAADAAHWTAFEAIDADPNNELIVALDGDDVVGTFQLTFTPSLSRGGGTRMTIEAVRVRSDRRGGGLGREMMTWALDRGRARGARLAQLTSDNQRQAAHRFYASLGFEASHVGMKRRL